MHRLLPSRPRTASRSLARGWSVVGELPRTGYRPVRQLHGDRARSAWAGRARVDGRCPWRVCHQRSTTDSKLTRLALDATNRPSRASKRAVASASSALTSRCERPNGNLPAKVGDPCSPALAHPPDRARRRPSHDVDPVARLGCFAYFAPETRTGSFPALCSTTPMDTCGPGVLWKSRAPLRHSYPSGVLPIAPLADTSTDTVTEASEYARGSPG